MLGQVDNLIDGSKPIRVTFLITGLGLGGAETQLTRIATHLKPSRWEIQVISMLRPGTYGQVLEAAGIPVLSLDMDRRIPSPSALLRVVRALRTFETRVLVCFMFHANILGRIAGALARVPVILSSVRTESSGGRWRDLAMRLTDRLGDITTTNSEGVARSLVMRGVVPKGRIKVIPNALGREAFNPQSDANVTRGALSVPASAFMWIAVGRMESAKDYPNLLRAFQVVAAKRLDAHLTIVGDGPLRPALESLVHDGNLSERVTFLGIRKDVPDLLAAADAFVLSSAWEGMPNALMEALAVGKPSVATIVGGTPELIREGETGFLVPPGDSKALAQAMVRMMEQSEFRRRSMSTEARKFMLDHFQLDDVVGMWSDLLLDCLVTKS